MLLPTDGQHRRLTQNLPNDQFTEHPVSVGRLNAQVPSLSATLPKARLRAAPYSRPMHLMIEQILWLNFEDNVQIKATFFK